MQEENLVSIDKRIQGLIQRHKSVKGKTPAHNKNKERIRDNIESLRNKRNSITGNPKSEPVEATDPYAIGMAQAMKSTGDTPPLEKSTIKKAHKIARAIQREDFAPEVAKERRTKASNEIDKHIKRIQDILDIESDKPHASHYKQSIDAMKSAKKHLEHDYYASDMKEATDIKLPVVTTEATGNGYHDVYIDGIKQSHMKIQIGSRSNGNYEYGGKQYALFVNKSMKKSGTLAQLKSWIGRAIYETRKKKAMMKEDFTVAQRQRKAIVMRRNKAKLSVGRRRASSRIADRERLLKRAKRRARKMIAKKLTRGQDNLSAARKSQIEKRLSKMSSKVERIQKRILPTVRKDDRGM